MGYSGPKTCRGCATTKGTLVEAERINKSLAGLYLCPSCASKTCRDCGEFIAEGDANRSVEVYGRTLCADCYDPDYR